MKVTHLNEADQLTERFAAALGQVLEDRRFDSLTVAQMLGVIELLKYAIIQQTPAGGKR